MTHFVPRSWIEIDLDALENNVRKIKSALPQGVKYIAVIKADAYGHCMPQSIIRLLKGGADMFAVANLYEVSRVRELVSSTPVLILGPVLALERKLVFEYDAIPAISTMEEALDFDCLARARGRVLDVHVKVDTGMGRYGVWHENAAEFIRGAQGFKNLRVAGIFTHLSSADCDPAYTKMQADNFKRVVESVDTSGMLLHLYNSAGLNYLDSHTHYNAVRVGLLQYGISPFGDSQKAAVDVEPVLSFKAKIAAISETPKGKIACVSAGYADGVPSGFTGRSKVLVHGKKASVLGNAGLDETIIDISKIDGVKEGDEVVFIGSQDGSTIDLPSYSRWTRRIPWETMVSIPPRVSRKLIAKK